MQIDIKTHIGQFALDIQASVIAGKEKDVAGLGLYHLIVHDTASGFYKGFEGKRSEMQYDAKHADKMKACATVALSDLFKLDKFEMSQYVPKTKPAPTLAEQLAGLGYTPEQIAEIVKGAKPAETPAETPKSPEITSES